MLTQRASINSSLGDISDFQKSTRVDAAYTRQRTHIEKRKASCFCSDLELVIARVATIRKYSMKCLMLK